MDNKSEIHRIVGTWVQLRSRLGADHPLTVQAHQEVATAKILSRVSAIMASAPALSEEQITQIALVLRGESSRAGGAQ
jgi:hypothetical protein